MEKVATNQLNDHLENENLLSDKQFGFRKGHSTEHALMITRHEIEKAQNEKIYTILITIDLSKAFDTVNSDEILPQKLKHYGCDKTAVNWFSYFFKDRNQYVTWNNNKFTTVPLSNISVVQGSSMGPPCFSVYINDLA
jgi:retron-type reverse transcriptase